MTQPIAKHKFEIPFNNDLSLIDQIAADPVLSEFVKFIYFPCNPIHGIVTSPGDRKNENTVDDTLKIMQYIQDKGFEPCVLIQRGDDLDGLSFYKDRGCRYFTIGDDNLAKKARDKYGDDVYLTASITKLISPEEYQNLDNIYDIYILQYYFNRHLDAIKELPKDNKYGLIVNTMCLWNCPQFKNHWFPDIYGAMTIQCRDLRFTGDKINFKNNALICPEDLYLFEDYVESYKLVDRMFATDEILWAFKAYVYGIPNSYLTDNKENDRPYN